MAEIQFARGVTEEVVPEIKVTRSKSGNSGTATFYFRDPKILAKDEGEIVSREVKGKFVNGEARGIEAVLIMKSEAEFERFVRFMNQYAEENGLVLDKN